MAQSSSRPIAFISMPVDFLLIGGLSIIHFTVYALGFHMPGDLLPDATAAAALAVWIINWPHFAATSYRLYQTRENIRQFPVTALAVPVLVFCLICASLKEPETVAPWFVKLFLLWSPYHFSAQTLGITLLYARRADIVIDGLARRFLSFFIFLTFIGPSLRADTDANPVPYYNITPPSFGLPGWVWPVSETLIVAAGCLALVLLWRSCRRQKTGLPLLLLLPAVAQFIWFLPGSGVKGFTEFVPAYHALQYLLIAWVMQIKTRLDTDKRPPSPAFALRESARWGAANIALGGLLFFCLPRLMHGITGVDLFVATGIVIVGVQIHHFFVDGVIWKLRNPNVRQPLMAGIGDLTGSAA